MKAHLLHKTMKLAGKPVDQEARRRVIELGVLDDHGHERWENQPVHMGQQDLRTATELLIELIFEKEVTHAE